MRLFLVSLLTAAALLATAEEPPKKASAPLTGLTLPVELKTTLKADKVHVGDPVRFRTVEPVLVHKGLILPENTHLFGHVIGASARQGSNPSWISIVVERAEWKDESLALHAYIAGLLQPSPMTQTGVPDASVTDPGNPSSVTHDMHVDPQMSNLGDPHRAIREQRAKDEQIFNQEHVRFSTGMDELKLARHQSGATLLVCEKHNVKLYSGSLFILQNTGPLADHPTEKPTQAAQAKPQPAEN